MCMYCLCRTYSKSQETLAAPNLTLAAVAPPAHPNDSHTHCRGPSAISKTLQEQHNGGTISTAKSTPSNIPNEPDDMDTDGEIDVDDCDDGEHKYSVKT